jgi:hypothetical protein
MLINPDVIEPTIGYLDEWIYYGYSKHYSDPTFYSTDYKISRLPWILFLFGMRNAIPLEALNFAIHFIIIIPTLFFVLINAKKILGLYPSIVIGIFFALNPFLISNGGAYYNNTLSGLFYAISFYYVTELSKENFNSTVKWVLLGIFIGLLLHTNIMFVNTLPIFIFQIYFLSNSEEFLFASWVKRTLYIFFGFIAISAVLGAVNKLFGRDFLFFLPIMKMAFTFVIDSTNQKSWWVPFEWQWYSRSTQVAGFMAIAFFSIAAIFLSRKYNGRRLYRSIEFGLIFQYIFTLTIWHIWQFIGQTSFYPFIYFAYPLIIPSIFSLGAAFSLLEKSTLDNFSIRIMGISLIFVPVIFYLINKFEYISIWIISYFSFLGKFSILSPFLLLLFAIYFLRNKYKASIVVLLIAIISGFTLQYSVADIYDNQYPKSPKCHSPHANFELMEAAQQKVSEIIKTSNVYVWFDREEKNEFGGCQGEFSLNNFAMSFGQTGFHYLDSPWPEMPAIEDVSFQQIKNTYLQNPTNPIVIIGFSLVNADFNKRFTKMLGLNNLPIKNEQIFELKNTYVPLKLNVITIGN